MMIFSFFSLLAPAAQRWRLPPAPTLRPRAPAAPRRLGATTPRMGAIPTVEERTTTARPKYNVGSAIDAGLGRPTRAERLRVGHRRRRVAQRRRQLPHPFVERDVREAAHVRGLRAGALTLVLAMPEPDAIEHAGFAQAQGFSCLGTWRKDECLELCEQLRGRDLSVRALPGVRGRQAWQGEPANTSPDALPSAP